MNGLTFLTGLGANSVVELEVETDIIERTSAARRVDPQLPRWAVLPSLPGPPKVLGSFGVGFRRRSGST